MKKYLLDTNVLIHIVRNSPLAERIISGKGLLSSDILVFISVVTVGEADSFAKQNGWGDKKTKALKNLVEKFMILDINYEDKGLIDAYAEIDTYSQKPPNSTARNMGKNDLWIAATAMIAKATLITTDADFDHLNNVYIQVSRYEVNK